MKTSPKKRTINTEHASSMQNGRGDERKKGWRSALGDDHDETARVIEDHFWETRLPPREDRLPPAEPHQSPRRPSPKSPRKPSPKKIAPTFEPDEDVIMNNSDEEVQFEEIMQETMRPAGPENWTLPIALPPRRHDPPNFLAMGQNCTAKATQQEPPITAKETPQQEELSSQASLTSLPTTPLMIRKRNVCRNVKSLDRPTFSQKGILKQRDDLSSSTITISTTSIAASVVHLGETQPPMKKIGKNLLTLSSVSSVSFIDPILKKKAEKEVEQRGQNEKQQQQEQQQEQVAPILPTPEPHRSEVMKAEPLVEDFDDENWKAEFDEKKRRELIEEIFQSIQRIPRKILEKTFDNMLLLEAEYYKIAKRRSDYLVKMADLHVDLRRKATFYG
ncbi:unnamed protein product, partial [Mesorhabditis belari]|uniref:Uncharacterized protein n=1 Tax=Mesorhabditis belari TaxID=2138241 RepID=A0AAF3F3F7_9BILA